MLRSKKKPSLPYYLNLKKLLWIYNYVIFYTILPNIGQCKQLSHIISEQGWNSNKRKQVEHLIVAPNEQQTHIVTHTHSKMEAKSNADVLHLRFGLVTIIHKNADVRDDNTQPPDYRAVRSLTRVAWVTL